jgi:hypothetical protein
MEGKILDYNLDTEEGLIRGIDEKRYEFSGKDIASQLSPKPGMEADFEINKDGRAVSIYITGGSRLGKSMPDLGSASGGAQKAGAYLVESLEDGVKNKLALGLCLIALISLFLPAVGFGPIGFSIMKHNLGPILLLLLLASAGILFTGASHKAIRITVGLYTAIWAYNLYALLKEVEYFISSFAVTSDGQGPGIAELMKLLDYGFYIWFLSSFLLFLIAMIGDFEGRGPSSAVLVAANDVPEAEEEEKEDGASGDDGDEDEEEGEGEEEGESFDDDSDDEEPELGEFDLPPIK